VGRVGLCKMMPNHRRLGSETATSFHFTPCRQKHAVYHPKTQPLLPSVAAGELFHLKPLRCEIS
jgi:hypothetical protein